MKHRFSILSMLILSLLFGILGFVQAGGFTPPPVDFVDFNIDCNRASVAFNHSTGTAHDIFVRNLGTGSFIVCKRGLKPPPSGGDFQYSGHAECVGWSF